MTSDRRSLRASALALAAAALLASSHRALCGELPGGWESRESGSSGLLVAVAVSGDGAVWASGIGVVKRSVNGGRTWVAVTPPGPTCWYNSVAPLSRDEAFLSGYPYGRPGGGVLLHTTDGGATWTAIAASTSPDACYHSVVFAADRRTGYVISTTDGLLRTTDSGATWRPVALPSDPTRIWIATRGNISLPDAATVVVGGDGALVRSGDGGETWSALALPDWAANPRRQFAWVHFASATRGWAGLADGLSLQTSDGGLTWERSRAPGRVFAQTTETLWAISQYEVSQSTDGGTTWGDLVRIGGGNFSLACLAFSSRRAIAVGGTENYGTTFIADRLLPGVASDDAPAGVIPITFSLPRDGFATVQITDPTGRVVQNLLTGRALPAGEHTVWWDLSTLDDFWPPFARTQPYLWEPPRDTVPVAGPGQYRWRGLWHAGLTLGYQGSYYPLKPEGLAWITPDGTGGWLGDHQAPQDVVRTGDTCWVGAFNEAGHCLLEADTQMRKLWGSARIELACPRVLAADGDFVYFLDEGGWLGFGGQRVALIQVNRHTRAARRLFAVGADQPAPPGQELRDIAGLAVRGNRAYIASRAAGGLVVCDLSDNLSGAAPSPVITGLIPLPSPGRVRLYDDHRLAAVSGDALVLVDETAREVTPVVTGLTSPLGLAVDPAGNLYVGEMAPSHQVKVFAPSGELLRTFGKPGKHAVGPWDDDELESPAGLEVDALGRVWVCEASEEVKRTSVWDAQGRCVNQVIGPAIYGGGATAIDPEDANHFFYMGQEFRRDPASGRVHLTNLMWRYDDARYDAFVEQRPHNFGGPAPSYPFYRDGLLFFSLWGGYGMGEVTVLWVYDTDHVRPVAACGRVPDWLRQRFGLPATERIFAWTDADEDGRVQAPELQTGPLAEGGAVWGVRMNANFEVAFSTVQGDVGAAFFRVAHLTDRGYPVWALPAANTMVPGFRTWDPSQVQNVFTDRAGNAVLVSPYILSLAPDGTVNWRYPCRWPGLHAGHATTSNGTEPGVLAGPLRFYGSGWVNDEVGEVLCLGSNFGATDLLTADGLYVGRAFQDCRRADAWAFSDPPGPARLAAVSLGQEHFGGSFQQVRDADGQSHFRYVISGDNVSCNVVELGGLDAIRRLPGGALEVSAQDCAQADLLHQQRAVQDLAPREYLVPRAPQITVDARADEWPPERISGFALAWDDASLYVLYQGRDDRATFRNAATEATLAEAFKRGDVLDVMLQTAPDADPERHDAAAGDVRLSFALVDGQPTAILYDYVVPGTPDSARHPFSSPWRTVLVDRVTRLEGARIAVVRQGDAFTLEASIPLADLHLDPTRTPRVRGDVGLVVSDQTGTRAVDRIYWSNPNTRVVSDLPSEARLQPNLWGTLQFAAP